MRDLEARGVLRVERLDGERLAGQREREGTARLGRALVARGAAVRCPRGASRERRRPDDEQGGHRQEDDGPWRTQTHQRMGAGTPPPAAWVVRARDWRRAARAPERGALPVVAVSPASR